MLKKRRPILGILLQIGKEAQINNNFQCLLTDQEITLIKKVNVDIKIVSRINSTGKCQDPHGKMPGKNDDIN